MLPSFHPVDTEVMFSTIKLGPGINSIKQLQVYFAAIAEWTCKVQREKIEFNKMPL